MHPRTRRGLALLSATAALAGGSLTTVTAAATAADAPSTARLLGLDLTLLLSLITGATVGTVQSLIGALSSEDLGDLLQAANAGQLTNLLQAADNKDQLTGALGTLTPAETGDLLAPLTGAQLTTVLGSLTTTQLQLTLATLLPAELAGVVDGLTAGQTAGLLTSANPTQRTSLLGALTSGQLAGALGTLAPAQLTTLVGGLTPAQISGLLGAGGTDSVLTGLLGQATSLSGGTPAAPQVNTLLSQITALLGGGGVGADLTDLAGLLNTVRPLLGTSGLDLSVLTSLLSTANGLLGVLPAPVAVPLQDLVTEITVLITPPPGGGDPTPGGGPTTGGTTAGGTTTPNATTARPAATQARPAAATTGTPFTAYRATIGSLKLNKKRTSMRFTLTCATTAPKGCLVNVSAKVAGKKAMRSVTLALPRGASTRVTVTLSKSTTRRLKTKGGSLKITAKTALSSLSPATRTLKVKRLKTKRATAR